MPTVTHPSTVYVRHEGPHAVVELTVTVAATCESCGQIVARRIATDEEQEAAIQEIGPWADTHADECHVAATAITTA